MTEPARSLDPAMLGRTLHAYLAQAGTRLAFRDRATARTHALPLEAAGDPAGVLPVFVVAGGAVWREAAGAGFAIDIRPDPDALFARRLHGVAGCIFSTVMLSVIEATEQATAGGMLLVNDLRVQWADRLARVKPAPSMAIGAGP